MDKTTRYETMAIKETKVFQIKHVIKREEDGEKIIFNKEDNGWVYHAPNAQNHTVEQLEIITIKLKKLNEDDNGC